MNRSKARRTDFLGRPLGDVDAIQILLCNHRPFVAMACHCWRGDRFSQRNRTDPASTLLSLPRRRQTQGRPASQFAGQCISAGRLRSFAIVPQQQEKRADPPRHLERKDERIPPSGDRLTVEQIERLQSDRQRRSGRSTRATLGYVKPKRPALPEVQNAAWTKNRSIDTSWRVWKRKADALSIAERERLIRRVPLT